MQLDRDFEIQCRQVWIEAWVRTAQSSSCIKLSTPALYADKCLEEFKERFEGVITTQTEDE